MGTFRMIRTASDLPLPGPLPEHLLLDFKAIKGPGQLDWEMAKDVASFANASGGVLLIGAEEVKGELVAYTPVPFSKAQDVAQGYQRVVDSLCQPRAIIDPRVIEQAPSAHVVAINVLPYPAPPIGVKAPSSAKEEGVKKAWSFPTRRGAGTHYLEPEELATVMDPVYRRKVLLVEQIPPRPDGSRPVHMHFVDMWKLLYEKSARTSGKPHPQYRMSIVEIDAFRGVMYAHVDRAKQVVLPLDAVQSVWQDHSSVECQMAIKGALVEEGGLLRFFPT